MQVSERNHSSNEVSSELPLFAPPDDSIAAPPVSLRSYGEETAAREAEELDVYQANGIPVADAPDEKPKTDSYPHDGGRFEVSQDGVYWCKGDGAKKRICDQLRVEAQTRDAHSGNWGLLLAWEDEDGKPHRSVMFTALLHGESTDAAKELASGGLRIAPAQGAKLRDYLLVCQPKARVRSVDQLGWHGAAYVTPRRTYGGAEDERIEFQSASGVSTDYGRNGTLEQWREYVGALAAGNSRLVLAMASAFAGPLLHIADEESGGLHLVGHSSSGKTTALKISASVWGHPDRYVRQWRATTNGMEGLAAVHNDGLLILDELSQCDPKEAGAAAYMFANGSAKVRMSKAITVRPSLTWRVLLLSSGELSLATHVESTGKRANAGQELRLVTIPADAGVGLGLFEDLHGHESAAAFSTALRKATLDYCGTAGETFLEKLVEEDRNALRETIREGVEAFVKEYAPLGASGQALRVARRFGLIAAAGELASASYGITGWEEGEADRGCGACYRAWLDSFGTGTQENLKLEEQVRGFIEKHGASRFSQVDDKVTTTYNRAGFWRQEEGGLRQYLVLPTAFKSDVLAGFDLTQACKVLKARGLLIPGNDGKSSRTCRIPSLGESPTRVYVLVITGEEA